MYSEIFNFQQKIKQNKIKIKFPALKILYILLAKNTIQFNRFYFLNFSKKSKKSNIKTYILDFIPFPKNCNFLLYTAPN